MYFTKDMWNLQQLLGVGTLIELEFIILLHPLETYPTVRSIQIYFSLIFIGRRSSSYKPCYVQSQSITIFSDLQHYRLFRRCHGKVTRRLHQNHEKVHPVWYLHIHTHSHNCYQKMYDLTLKISLKWIVFWCQSKNSRILIYSYSDFKKYSPGKNLYIETAA